MEFELLKDSRIWMSTNAQEVLWITQMGDRFILQVSKSRPETSGYVGTYNSLEEAKHNAECIVPFTVKLGPSDV